MGKNVLSSIFRGGWQLTPGHQRGKMLDDCLAPIIDAINVGFRVFDCADIYSGVEDLLGCARLTNDGGDTPIRIHTKFVPDLDRLASIDFAEAQEIVDQSLRRLRTDCVDLVQFHWWDYRVPRYLEVLGFLFRLKEAGKIRAIGLTNFNSDRLLEIIHAGFNIASIQVQYSLIDRRCEATMISLCKAHGINVFTYGSLLGGFLNASWLDKPEPDTFDLPNRSLVKYKLIIDDWGGWNRYQMLLKQMAAIATHHSCAIPQIAIASLLHSERVDGIIVGLSQTNYKQQNAELANMIRLSDDELKQLWSWDCSLQGDVYQLERTSNKHAKIMKYNLNHDAGHTASSRSHG